MKKIYFWCLLILLIVALLPHGIKAQNRTQRETSTYVTATQAMDIGYAYMRTGTGSRSGGTQSNAVRRQAMQLVYTGQAIDSLTGAVTDCYYVFALQPMGFVIVAADERVEPILGYSYDNNFVVENMPEQVRNWLGNYERQIEVVVKSDLQPEPAIQSKWTRLKNGQSLSTRNGESVGPLLQTTWNQNSPYNLLCPSDENGPGGHVYAGCVATAIAQIMRYWQYPTNGIGSHSYTANYTSQGYGNYGTQSANFAAATYNYSLMPLSLNSNTSTEQINEVAQLIYHCGVAVNMMYGSNGSGAYISDAATAFRNYFGYSNATVVSKSSYTSGNDVSAWIALLKEDLDNLRPIYYSGQGTGGHAFVCDGYDDQNNFHFNWGWSGSNNGFYTLSSLTPGTHNYSSSNMAIIGVDASVSMIHVSNSSLNFLAEAGSVSSSKSVSLLATHLNSNITATVTGNFRISIDDANFYTSSTLSSSGGILYVRYQPTGTAGVEEGYVALSSGTVKDTIFLTGVIYDNTPHCLPPANLSISSQDIYNISLQWDAPTMDPDPQTLSWSSNSITTCYGYTSSDYTKTMLQRFDNADLAPYHNKALTSIKFVARPGATVYKAVVYKGGSFNGDYNPGTLVLSQDINVGSVSYSTWKTITLNTPIMVDASEELWFGIYVEAPAGTYCMPVNSQAMPKKGCICGTHSSSGSVSWNEFMDQYSFCIIGTVENVQTVTNYTVARNGTTIGTTTNTSLTDVVNSYGSFTYTVTANWDNGCNAMVSDNVEVSGGSDTTHACLTLPTATVDSPDFICYGDANSTIAVNITDSDVYFRDWSYIGSASESLINKYSESLSLNGFPAGTHIFGANIFDTVTHCTNTIYDTIRVVSVNAEVMVESTGAVCENDTVKAFCNYFQEDETDFIINYQWFNGNHVEYVSPGVYDTVLVIPTLYASYLSLIVVDNHGCTGAFGRSIDVVTCATLPSVTTGALSNILATTATGGGNVTDDGGATVTERGICWSNSPNPTVGDSHTTDGSGVGAFTSQLTGLAPNTTYYVRSYATNSEGMAYGEEVMFTTLSCPEPLTIDTTVCVSELPLTWFGHYFNGPETYTTTYQTSSGCDSVVTLTLIVNNINNEAVIVDTCDSYTWIDGITYTASTDTPTYTLTSATGCDSVVTLLLTIYNSVVEQVENTICSSELPYTWNGVEFTQSGTQIVHLTTKNGCDSAVTMTLTVNPTYAVTDIQTICASELPYMWNNVQFTEAGTQTTTLQTINGCDSVVTMILTVNPTYEVTDVQTICASELPYMWNNVQFTEAGTQTTTLQTVNGCDSVVTMTLFVNPLYNVTEERSVCAAALPYTWNEVTFIEAGTQTATLQSVNNCDSVVTMILSVNDSYNVTDTKSICFNELPYTWNGVTFTEAGTQSVTLTAANDCDSVVTMILTVNPVYEVSEAKTICASELPYTWNNVQFTEAGTQTTTLQTINGCDSVVTMMLIVNSLYNVTEERSICAAALPYTWNGVTFTEAGTQTTTLQTINGCDSVVTMTLIVNPIYAVTDAQTICASELPYTWNNVQFTEAGTQTTTLQTVNGCDSVVTMNLTVNPLYNVTEERSVCAAALPYTWNEVIFTEAGTQSVTLTAANDCDSVVTMTLTVNPVYEVNDTQTICASELPYTWNNVQFTEAGTQTTTLQTVNGCDSVVTMNLTVNPLYNVTEERSVCAAALPYTWNGVTFTEASTQTATLHSVNNCDSVVTMILSVNSTYNVTDTKSICFNELPYTWNGVTFTEAGTQSVTLTAANDCDSVVTMILTVNPVYEVSEAKTICASELPYTWNNVQFTEAGTQTTTLQTVNGCDSVVTMTLTVNPTYAVTDTQTICASELPYTWNNVQFTEAGTQTTVLQTINGCDSVVTMTLFVNPLYNVTEERSVCAAALPYTWNEVIFTEAGTQTATLQSVNNCDSVVTMILSVNSTYIVTDTKSICFNELPYTWNGVTFTEAGTQSVTLTAANDCDSVVTMTLTVNPIYVVTDTQTICASQLPYTWNNVQFTEAGTQTTTLQTVNGCDSVVTMTLIVNPIYSVTDTQTICASELPYTWNNVQFTEAGTQTTTLQTVNGCDSVVTMTLFVNPLYNVTEERSVCAAALPYTWNEVTFTEAGTQSVTLTAANDCDSVVTMTLTVNLVYEVTDTQTICASELPYTWNNVQFTEAGTQTTTLQTVNGCDSVVTMTLTVNPVYEVTDAQTICASELPYTWNNVQFTEAGSQTTTLQTVNGCDSVVTMTLTVNPTYAVTDTQTICASELPYMWNNVQFTEAGTQTTNLQTVNGCDSVVTMTLIVNPIYSVTDTQTICASELPYTWNNVQFTEAGTQTTTLQTVNGCDSVVTMTLTVNPIYAVTDTQTICASELPYTWNNVQFTEAGTQTTTLQTVNGCDSVVTMTLTVNNPMHTATTEVACESFIWNGVTYTESGDYTYSHQDANGCTQVDTLHLTINNSVSIDAYLTINESDLPFTYGDTTFLPGSVQSGDYFFYFTTADGCDSIIVLHLTVEPVGISNYVANASMKVYPNPTSGVLNVELTTNNVQSSDVKIQVFDVYGKLLDIVETQNVASLQTTQIDLSPYSSGVYFIKAVVGDHQLGVRKIVKQ